MKENNENFTEVVFRSVGRYWQEFLVALPRIALAVILLILVILIASYISKFLNRRLSGKAHDPLFGQFISKLVKFALIVGGVILFLHVMGLSGIASGLLAGAGISAFVFGFAFKDIAENFLAGIILAFNRPFNLNDTVKIEEYTGHVMALNFRTTHIKTFDEKDVFIPNAKVIKETLVNLTQDGLIRMDFIVGIAYEDDINGATDVILKALENIPDILADKKPFVTVEEMAASTVNLRVYFWTSTDDYKKGVLLTRGNVVAKIKEALIDKGYTLPANIQEIKLYDKRDTLPVSVISANGKNGNDGLEIL